MNSLYIHIPFCKKKCHYCDFVSYPGRESLISDYLSALEKEILSLDPRPYPIATVFIGGGTPSVLSPEQIKKLFDLINKYFDCSRLKEITFEANPESLSEKKLKAILELNPDIRLSLGLQCFDNKYLKTLGRIHTSEEFLNIYKTAKNLGFKNINIDLIYGIPGQTTADWQNTLKAVVDLKPEHISAYCLTLSEGTYFVSKRVTVDENLTAEMYEKTTGYLENCGYKHYEISNFASPGYECAHNKVYWENREYLGLGCSAVSYINGARRKNVSDLGLYLQKAGTKDRIEKSECLDENRRLSETIMLGLRMRQGVELTPDIKDLYSVIIEKHLKDGFLGIENNRMFVTQKGLFVSNRIMADFLPNILPSG